MLAICAFFLVIGFGKPGVFANQTAMPGGWVARGFRGGYPGSSPWSNVFGQFILGNMGRENALVVDINATFIAVQVIFKGARPGPRGGLSARPVGPGAGPR